MSNLIKSAVATFIIFEIVRCAWAHKPKTPTTWAETVAYGKEHTTILQFYFHDTVSGKSPSALPIAKPADSNRWSTGFGELVMADEPLTVGPGPNSKLVGRAQGLYGVASQEEVSLFLALTYSFSDGIYNGSSVSIVGRNSIMTPVRELPVLGGTGLFRMARGFAVLRTYSFNTTTLDAIVGYNVTVIHY